MAQLEDTQSATSGRHPKSRRPSQEHIKSTKSSSNFLAKFAEDLWESIFTPGVTSALEIAIWGSFAALSVLLGWLMWFTEFNIHVINLSVIATILFLLMRWFIPELKAEMARQEREKTEKGGKDPSKGSQLRSGVESTESTSADPCQGEPLIRSRSDQRSKS